MNKRYLVVTTLMLAVLGSLALWQVLTLFWGDSLGGSPAIGMVPSR